MSEEARASRQDPKGWPSGPRSLLLRRDHHHGGFGFTLRHFIVYPPESYTVLAGDRRLGLRPGALDEPMDTIFVRSVKPGGAADRAGLRTGDRVVSVNGENIGGHSYAGVVHRIHNSGPTLHLLVVPQQLDILQLYFNETAHRPESNLDLEPAMVRAGGVSTRHNGAWDGTGARRVPATDGDLATTAGCRLSLDADRLMGRRDSSSQEGSLGDLSSDDSVIISRIRRSCEQKREFLAAPAWPQDTRETNHTAQVSGIKEFYGRPQKLQPPPHWPPNIPGSPNHSPSRKEREDTPPRERGFVCGGPVTNAPCDRSRPRPGFVNTLTRIQETTPPSAASPQSPPLQFQVVSQRARQFESGNVPDRTSLYRSELARLSNKRMVPDVTVRAREFESKTDRHGRESRSLDSAGNMPPNALSGNRLVPVGGRKLHCEPPNMADAHQLSYDENLRPRSNSAEASWLDETWPQRHRAVRQDSYLAACHKPALPPEGSGTEEESNASLGSPVVVWRDKALSDAGSEEDRATRRVSYLKATWPDRMNVDSDPDVSDTEPPVSGVEARVSLCGEDLSLPDKENLLVTREGLLHCKLTLIDGKRATDRSWKQVWAVLRGPVLYLYKERRDSLPQAETPAGVEAEQVDVRCALVAPADNYTKRKHVLRLNTLSGSELLLQAADAAQMARWIVSLEEQANNNNTQNASGPSLSPASAQKGLRKLTSLRNRSPTGQSPVNKTRKPSQQVEPPPVSSPKSKTWKGRVAKQLRRIQHSGSPTTPHPPSPSAPTYPEGATIGIPLEDCPPSAMNEFVPLIVELCTSIVEERGLDIIGIYRVPGNTAAVSSLTEAVNRGLDAALLDQDQRWSDVNVISSLLKSFFRRLPDSLLTTELYPSFIQADKITDPHLRMATIRKLVHELPDHHYETLKYLLLHLRKVVDHSATNKMEARNLAIVFGPTLVRAADDNMVTMVTDMSHQCRIVETLILHVDWCFGDDSVLPELEGEAGVEPDPAVANHNLLLSNIHKVEGMTRELSARDIVSSIICAANRKMMKSKTRKSHHQAQPQAPSTAHAGDDAVDDNKQVEKSKGSAPSQHQHRKERLSSTPGDETVDGGGGGTTQNIPAAPRPTSLPDKAAETESQTKTARPQAEAGTIRTYAGLSATTQERIRRFELETKAMLHRDAARLRRLEVEREQSKRELETDDHTNTPAIVKKIAECGRSGVKPLAVVSPCNGGRRGEGGGLMRRGSSAENIHRAGLGEHGGAVPATATTVADCGNLKRFKSGKDQGEAGLARCGSLDSVHDLTPSERPPSHVSDEGGDLLVSLTSTFDAKLRSLLSSGASENADAPSPSPSSSPLFTDPSLHKATDKEGKEEEAKEECCVEKEKSDKQSKPSKEENTKENDESNKENTANNDTSRVVHLYRSESVNKDERNSLTKSDSFKLKRSESLNKDSNSKLKRSDSLTKNEKTESNLNKRRQLEAGRWNNAVKLKRKTGSAIDRSIKRRHTVGGTKDFDKVHWLDNRQREAEEEESKKERRTSSPDLSSSRLSAVVVLRPHSFAEPNLTERHCAVPLESHV